MRRAEAASDLCALFHTPPSALTTLHVNLLDGLSRFTVIPSISPTRCHPPVFVQSSLMLTLFRLIDCTSGRIMLDGLDISTVGLDALRRQLAIIPQDPVLFSGTIR